MKYDLSDQLGVWKLPPNLRSCLNVSFNTKGFYDPLRFVLRLRPDIHRTLESLEPGVSSLSPEAVLAYSTFFHENVHWWQHIGSTCGLLLSLMYPAQTHINRRSLSGFADSPYNVKPLSKLAEIWAQNKANSGIVDPLNPNLNRILNNWHDMESFRWLITNPTKSSEVFIDEYFYSSGHCYEMAVGSFLWLLAATMDRDQTCVPDPRKWEEEFAQLARNGTPGFAKGSALSSPPLGALEIFEGQARFSQMQFLRGASRKWQTWTDFKVAGMFKPVYTRAFEYFCTSLGEPLPSDPKDSLVGMFLLVCDLAMNPAEFLFVAPQRVSEIEQAINPGHRFAQVCEVLKRLGPSFYRSILAYSRDEYEHCTGVICKSLGWITPIEIGNEMARWVALQPSIATVLSETDALTFAPENMPVRLFVSATRTPSCSARFSVASCLHGHNETAAKSRLARVGQ